MASISTYLQKILDAVYGEEVRGSIHDAIAAMNVESSNAMQYAATAKDSAKASASSAEESASTAKKKAAEAADSAALAAGSADAARVSEQKASLKAGKAADSAAFAAESEEKAANAEAMAIQKAQEAEAAKSAAAQSAAEAAASEDTTRTLRGEAETLAGQAKADKEAAEAAKEVAQAARDAAKVSEQKAKDSETNALSAQSIAVQAKKDAEDASADAKNAAEATKAAQKAAEDAQSDAEVASKDAADSASEAAESAKTAKEYSGKPAKPDPVTKTWWIWDADLGDYVDTGISTELAGPQGVGISDIKLTSGNHTPGTTDIYTVELTNGTTYNISVWNGRNGEGAGDVLGRSFDLVIPAAGWSDGQITIADERLLALSTHKYFIAADEASREEFLDCKVQPKDITTTGFITFTNETDPESDLTVSVIRFELSANG